MKIFTTLLQIIYSKFSVDLIDDFFFINLAKLFCRHFD